MPHVIIREERPADIEQIATVTREAFARHPYSRHTEQFIIDALRRENTLKISLVAEAAGTVVGHIAFSPVAISDGSSDWYGLGPVSVAPALQGQGIGQELVVSGLKKLRTLGARGCVLVGEPAFYGRFGFSVNPEILLPAVPPEFFLALAFGEDQSKGTVTFDAAFSAEA